MKINSEKLRLMITKLTWLMITLQAVTCSDDIKVKTENGFIEGKFENVDGVDVRAWFGIPYAQPPIKELRFKRPQPLVNWSGVKKTTSQPNVCFQTSDSGYMVLPNTFDMWDPKGTMSEDCLYLNIYAPKKAEGMKYSTMVWIHGGGFYKGAVSLEQYNPKKLAAKYNVIVVTIQYRLGVLGFLYFKDELVPGNMGLLDQAMAIKWVSANIESFGGNKNDITLMGESAGSASVGYHMISKRSRNLFQKAIMQSGSPFCFWGYSDPSDNFNRSRLFAAYAGCKEYDFRKLMNCLMKKSAQELLSADKSILSVAPTIDGVFIQKSPFESIEEKDFAPKPVLGGLVQNEGMPGLIYFLKNIRTPDYNHFTPEDFEKFIGLLGFYAAMRPGNLMNIAYKYSRSYTHEEKTDYEQTATHIFGDFFISCGAIDFLSSITSPAYPVYFYYFNHRWERNPDPSYTEVMHGSEIQFQFGQPFVAKHKYSENDRKVSDQMMSLWSEFAKSSKPELSWQPYLTKTGAIHEIRGATELTKIERREKFCDYWRKYKPRYDILKATDVKNFMENAVMLKLGKHLGKAVWELYQKKQYEDVW